MKKYAITLLALLISLHLVSCEEDDKPEVPQTLNDCYVALNKELEKESESELKNDIKKAAVKNLIRYHFSLGMWIRNNWRLWQTDNRLTQLFINIDIEDPDDMSTLIIMGYHYYLNGIEKTMEELVEEYIKTFQGTV